ncbi:MAG: SIR2 family protein, partial [Nitrososphaera sp.]|nr:SIR2 family protein [Nitrososphaera sp.]
MKAIDLERRLGKRSRKGISDLAQVIVTRPDDNQNYCLLLGAGASRTSGIRTASELVEEWRSSAYQETNPNGEDTTPEAVKQWLSENEADWYDPRREYATLIEKIFPLPKQRRRFIETEVAEKPPSIGYAYLVRLAEARHIRTIFTTNFDDLLNEAFYQFSAERPLVCAHDSSVSSISITSRRTKIIKLHGDYLFDDLKLSSTETQALERNMEEKLTEFLKEYGLIVVGYSGSDKSITRNLDKLLKEAHCLQNGLYWCFRNDDHITDDTLEILGHNNAFFVLIDGFDEIIAELYAKLVNNSAPFNAKIASDRASTLIESYLRNTQLRSTSSTVIQKHLEELSEDKTTSLITDALNTLNAESLASSGLSDANLLVLLEIERDLKARNLAHVLQRIEQELEQSTDRRFKEVLL